MEVNTPAGDKIMGNELGNKSTTKINQQAYNEVGAGGCNTQRPTSKVSHPRMTNYFYLDE
jgi:hypothetical protein